jgi:hypothetical protein
MLSERAALVSKCLELLATGWAISPNDHPSPARILTLEPVSNRCCRSNSLRAQRNLVSKLQIEAARTITSHAIWDAGIGPLPSPHANVAIAAPATIAATPSTRPQVSAFGATFSSKMKVAMPATQTRFITPPTNSNAISTQQHPRQ